MTLHAGLNLAYLVEDSGGSGTYARELMPALMRVQPDLRLTAWVGATAPDLRATEPWAEQVTWIRLPVPGHGTPWHLWYELCGIGLDARRRGIDVVHGPAYLAPAIHPRVAMVATLLDVIWAHHPDTASWRFTREMRVLATIVGRTADRLVAISAAARDDVAETLHLDRARFDVVPLGITPPPQRAAPERAMVQRRLGLGPEPLVLCVAAKRPHKNLQGLIRAIAQLPAPRPQLVLPGSPNEHERELRALAAQLGVADAVHFPGWLAAGELEDLYALADVFVLPTFAEGFGLPVLEAMIRGVPVACSQIPVLTEVAGDAAAYFDPHDPVTIAAAIERVLGDGELAARLRAAGAARARELSWERTARLTLDCYARALDGRRGGAGRTA